MSSPSTTVRIFPISARSLANKENEGSGTAEAYFTGSPYATLAETHGFIVIYPESPYEGTCWDVSSSSTLTANGGGNSNSIANMVAWTTENYKADTKKVFVTGTSSGAMMTVFSSFYFVSPFFSLSARL